MELTQGMSSWGVVFANGEELPSCLDCQSRDYIFSKRFVASKGLDGLEANLAPHFNTDWRGLLQVSVACRCPEA